MRCPNCDKNFDDELGMCPYCGYVEGETIKKKDKPKCPLWAKIIIPVALVVVAVVSALYFTGVIGGDSGQQTEFPISDEASESMDDEEILNDDDMVADNDSEAEDEAVTEETEETETKEIESIEKKIEEKETGTTEIETEPEEIEAEIIEEGTCGENLTWTFDNTGTLTISGTGEMYDFESPYGNDENIAPWLETDSENKEITAVVIEEGVTSIGESAFENCVNLESIDLPDSLTCIGDFAFEYCSSLKSIDLPDNLTSIGNYAFESCTSLESANLPDGLISIGVNAFSDCISLSSINIPYSVTDMRYNFFDWTSDQTIYIQGRLYLPYEWMSSAYGFGGDAKIVWEGETDLGNGNLDTMSNELIKKYQRFDTIYESSGIHCRQISDWDLDGEDELFVCRSEVYEDNGSTYFRTLAEIYEEKDGDVVLVSSITLRSYNDPDNPIMVSEEYNTYLRLVMNIVSMESEYYFVFTGYSSYIYDSYTNKEDKYSGIWVLEYKDEKLQYVCSWDVDGANCDGSLPEYAYEFEDGVNTKTTIYYPKTYESYYSDWDNPDIELAVYDQNSMKDFFRKYGLIFEYGDTSIGLANYSYQLSETISDDAEIMPIFSILITIHREYDLVED